MILDDVQAECLDDVLVARKVEHSVPAAYDGADHEGSVGGLRRIELSILYEIYKPVGVAVEVPGLTQAEGYRVVQLELDVAKGVGGVEGDGRLFPSPWVITMFCGSSIIKRPLASQNLSRSRSWTSPLAT